MRLFHPRAATRGPARCRGHGARERARAVRDIGAAPVAPGPVRNADCGAPGGPGFVAERLDE
jgi:hypothetical protein